MPYVMLLTAASLFPTPTNELTPYQLVVGIFKKQELLEDLFLF